MQRNIQQNTAKTTKEMNNWKMWICRTMHLVVTGEHSGCNYHAYQWLIAGHREKLCSWRLPDISDICRHFWCSFHMLYSKCACTAAADNHVECHSHYTMMTLPSRSVMTSLSTTQHVYTSKAYCLHYLSLIITYHHQIPAGLLTKDHFSHR